MFWFTKLQKKRPSYVNHFKSQNQFDMKTSLFRIIAVVIFFSCSSVDKLVRQGKYEAAFDKGISYFRSDKKRDTDKVKAFEKAWSVMTERTEADTERLSWSSRPADKTTLVRLYEDMDRRQSHLKTILPLISEDGYEARFTFKDYRAMTKNARSEAADSYYSRACNMLMEAENKNDKDLARKAYYEFEKAEDYMYDLKELDRMKERALGAGHKIIYVDINNEIDGIAGQDIDRLLWGYAIGRHDDKWHSFRFRDESVHEKGDLLIWLDIMNLNISSGKEDNVHFTEQKEILVRTEKWVEQKDSTTIEKVREVYENVSAKITETFREKKAFLDGRIRVFDQKKNSFMEEKPVHVNFSFADRGMIFLGDERALTEDTKKKLDPSLDSFPDDSDIVAFLINEFKKVMQSELNRCKS